MSKQFILNIVVGCVLTGGIAGCGGGGADHAATRIENPDPEFDADLDEQGIVCKTTYTISGTFTPDTPIDVDDEDVPDCPDGTWEFTLTPDFTGCDPQPVLNQEFVYTAITDENAVTSVTYEADPDDIDQNLKLVTDGGPSLCYGIFEHPFVDDKTSWSFRPEAFEDGTITGTGAYALWVDAPGL